MGRGWNPLSGGLELSWFYGQGVEPSLWGPRAVLVLWAGAGTLSLGA